MRTDFVYLGELYQEPTSEVAKQGRLSAILRLHN